ncbi:MAG: exodeoxyribonuclease VII large subunit [Fibrobacterota bacterium]
MNSSHGSDLFFDPPALRSIPYSVSEINSGIAAVLKNAGEVLFVTGEVVSIKEAASGHVFLRLSDTASYIPAVIWRWARQGIEHLPTEGDTINLIALLRVYERGGYYQLDIRNLWNAGAGDMRRLLQKRKEKLEQDGLFDEKRKKAIPDYIETVGVITAERSAAFHDIYSTLKAGASLVNIIFAPAPVQGERAPEKLKNALEALMGDSAVDIIIIGRGGGARDDLMAFNDEDLVRCAARSTVPIISAVGHEIDNTLLDLAADYRTATPTAAAELIVSKISGLELLYQEYIQRFALMARERLRRKFQEFYTLSSSAALANYIKRSVRMKDRVADQKSRLIRSFDRELAREVDTLKELEHRLDRANPLNILKQGYALVLDSRNNTVTTSDDIKENDRLTLRFRAGSATARIENVIRG